MNTPFTIQTAFRLSRDEFARLRERADQLTAESPLGHRKVSVSDVVRQAVAEYLAKTAKAPPRKAG